MALLGLIGIWTSLFKKCTSLFKMLTSQDHPAHLGQHAHLDQRPQVVDHPDSVMDQPVSILHAHLDQHAHPCRPACFPLIPLWTSLFHSSMLTWTSTLTLSSSLLSSWTSLLMLILWTSLFQSFFLDQPALLDQPARLSLTSPLGPAWSPCPRPACCRCRPVCSL
jgi:hypothetical protein